MSADSPNHTRSEPTSAMQNTVTPQPVTDPTILDSVAGFINEVVPTTGNDTFDIRDQIQWARFENLDWDESNFSINSETQIPSSLILVLGYTTGIQVWAIPANGEAIEIFSWRHGSVKLLRILPTPYKVGSTNKIDAFELKRPLIALIDVVTHGSSASSLNFYSLKTGEQVKQIKFKNQILDVLANRRSVIITFPERIAVFDAFTLEDKLSLTGCYLSPGIQQNPVALGPRWLAYADKKLIASRRSSGGNEGEGVQSYTATVLHAAKSLGRGLRELGDAVASSLTGNQTCKLGTSPNSPQAGGSADIPQKGIVTIMDIESPTTQNADGSLPAESVVAHFVAHSEAIVWLQFGPCGMLLLTADKRGHDFNLFRINPHPLGSSLAAIHHLYTLHRGDTSARVQDMCFSFDSRWVTVSTLRGTTHVFPITPYGGNIGVRTHTTPHVVNKMSRFHRSAGLTGEGRSNSPVSMFDAPVSTNFPYHNPRFAPFPHPTVINPLAQLRQPVYMQNIGTPAPRQGRQRLTSSSEDNIALRITACFAPARAWIDSLVMQRETALNKTIKPVDSLFVMNCHGTLVQYDLEPHCTSNIPKERICDDSPIELTVIAKAQWRLQRQPMSVDRPLPVPHQNLLFVNSTIPLVKKKLENGNDDDWLSQVEIITHAGPHRRLWMGPQFTFKTYTTTNGTPMSLADAQPLDLNRSKPVNMPITKANAILIESSSASSSEQSLLDIYKKNCEEMGAAGEHQIKEDLADAMIESPGVRESDDSSSSTDNLRVKQELEKELDDVFESTKKTEKDPGTKTKREKALKTGSNILKNLDIVEDISFPALDDKLVNPEFPPLEENFFSLENIPKVEHFEDAEDCGLPLETVEKYFAEEPKPQSKALDTNVSDIGSSDTVSTSEDNIDDQKEKMKKKSPLKLRKSKAKLGVKIQKSVAVELISSVKDDVVEAEITLPPPKKSWSSIVAQPQKTQEVIQDVDSIITDQFETYTATIPKKVHSNVTTEKLLDIETPEERQDFSASLRGNLLDIDKSENFPKGDSSADLLKLSDKSSDDEKNESGSSPTETTESSDEGKTVTVITASVVKPPNRTGGKKKKRR
ncbi:breast carcinoma-amplified sequence 3 homolog isoform X3 [Rhynchophorus ferrugineus]|uniref:breast carcinoma-amplified sequence 3 homolog isoform X3 n=1 Tax=Rhynchophorus ferrugineus TaxID=354439 RepID=UPI003FCCE1B9